MAEVVYRLLETLNMVGEVEAICFDTTSSNSGIHRGSVKLLQDKLNRPIMFLACRHHIGELAIKHTSEAVQAKVLMILCSKSSKLNFKQLIIIKLVGYGLKKERLGNHLQ